MTDISSSVERHHNTYKDSPGPELIDIPDGGVRRLWSYNSANGGHYVYMTSDSAGDQGYYVAANGKTDGTTSTDIIFKLWDGSDEEAEEKYKLMFESNKNELFFIKASKEGVTASQGDNAQATLFSLTLLEKSNAPYAVVKSDTGLYLSSDGSGKMKLKQWNSPVPPPPDTLYDVDPALLFRVVRPRGKE